MQALRPICSIMAIIFLSFFAGGPQPNKQRLPAHSGVGINRLGGKSLRELPKREIHEHARSNTYVDFLLKDDLLVLIPIRLSFGIKDPLFPYGLVNSSVELSM